MENRRPSVVLKHYDFDSASDIEQFNSRSDDHKLYINMSPSKSSVSDKSQLEKNFYLKKSSRKIIRNGDSPLTDVPKRVSFSNRSRILYFNKDSDALYSEEVVDNVVHTSEQPFVDPSSAESKDSEISSEDKQFHAREKDLVIVLEKLPIDLVKQVEKENCDLGECFQSVTPHSDSQNFNESSNLQSTESQVSELTKSSENILSNDRQKFTSSTNSSSELNTSLHQKLNISIQRLPNHLLELHLNNNSLKSFEENVNSGKEGYSYNEDLSLTENKVSETEVNDLSLLQHPASDTDSDSLHSTPSKQLRQGSCEHENGVCNCDLSIRNSCVLIERLNGDVYSSHCTQNEPQKQVSCQHKISVYNSGIPAKNTCVPNETSNGDVNLLHSNESLKQEPREYNSNASNSDVSSRSPFALNEALNGQANSLYSIPTKQLKQEPCEHESNVYSCDVSVRNPCVLNEALNADVISSYSTQSQPLKQESCDDENNVLNSDVSTNNPSVPNEALNRDVNSPCPAQSEPMKQESCDDENNVHNSDVSTNNPSVPNEVLNKDVNSSCPVPSEPINQEPCNKNNIFNCDISIRNPCVLLERLELIVPNMDSIQSTEKFQKRKVNDKDILYNEQDDLNGNLVETESNIVLGSADKNLTRSSKLSKTSKGKKRPTIKSGSAGNNPKRLSNAVKALKKKSKSQLEVRNKTSISLNNTHLPSHKVAEIIPVNSHDLSCATNVVKQCSLKLTKTKHLPKSQINYKHTEPSLSKNPLKQKSYQYKSSASSSEDETPLAKWSKQSSYVETPTGDSDRQLLEKYSSTENQSSISDNSSSEDDIALSLLSKPEDIEPTNYLCNQEKNTFPFSYLKNSNNINQTSGISNLNVSEMSTSTGNQYHIPNFTSSEDDIPLSLVHKLSNVNQTKIDGRVKKKKRSQESKTIKMQRFTDLNVMHMVEATPPNSLTFMSDAIKKVKKKPAAKKIERKKLSREGMLLYSCVNDMNNSKQMKISGHSERKIEKIQKSKTSKIKKFTDANVMHVAEVKTPNSLSFISDFKKKAKKFPSTKQVEREKLSNKDMPSFSCLNDMDNVKQSSGNKKKKKQSQKNETSKMQNFTDFNVVHAAERMTSNSLRFKSDFKKKVKKIVRNIPPKEELSFSSSSEIDSLEFLAQGKKCKMKKPLESGAKKRKSKPVLPPNRTKLNCINESTLISQYNKASNCKNNSVLHLKSISDNCYYETVESDTDCEILPPLKKKKLDNCKLSCNVYDVNKEKSVVTPIKNGTVTKKSKKKKDCQSKDKRTSNEVNYINESTLISQYNKASNCKNNSAFHLKSISDNCYYETVESDTDCEILPPLKKKKLDNYKLSCNMYEANKEKSVVAPIKNETVSKKSKKKEDCQSKNKRTSNELHTSLRNYLNKFFTEFDSLGVSKKKELSFSQQENKMIKKRERIYKMLISEMFHHLKNTCSIKKSYKRQRLKEKFSKRSPGQLSPRKLELKNDFPSTSAQTKGNSQKREGNKENHTNKFQLGFLTGDNYLKLYNRCVAAERLILLKYKMKKQQRRKIKRFFKTLKKNSLKRN